MIWQKLKKPFFCLAPMADVTDIAFRQTMTKYGKPDVFWTEFVSADGLASEKGRKKLLPVLRFEKKEKPIVAQIFGANPENIKIACEIVSKLGFDGVDINMGCPDKKVVRQEAGAALIKNPSLAREIIRAAKEAGLPVSVKTRIGFNTMEYKTWLPELLKEDFSALTIHLRTKKEMSKVPAHWELAKDIAKIVRKKNKNMILIANGDVKSLEEGREKAKKCGFDGIMVGRGVLGNPWFFTKKKMILPEEKISALKVHIKLFEKYLKNLKNFAVMKKHFKAYISGFDGAKELRSRLMSANSPKDALRVLSIPHIDKEVKV